MASIEDRGNGTYRVVWRFDGRKATLPASTFKTAERIKIAINKKNNRISEEEAAKLTGFDVQVRRPADAQPLTVAEWGDKWVDANLKAADAHRVRSRRIFEVHINPMIGDILLSELTSEDCAKWIRSLEERGFSGRTITRFHAALNAALEFAIVNDKIAVNVARAKRIGFTRDKLDVDDLDHETEHHVYLSTADFTLILENAHEDSKLLFQFLGATGLRISEATALMVGDIYLGPRPHVLVRRAFVSNGHGGYKLGVPKSQRARKVSISTSIAQMLQTAIAGRSPKDHVFLSPEGYPLLYSNVRSRRWDVAVAAARRCLAHPPAPRPKGKTGPAPKLRLTDVSTCDCAGYLRRKPTLHDLRHSHVAWLIAAGSPLVAISKRLGHTTITVTERTYAGILPEVHDEMAEAMEGILFGKEMAERPALVAV